MGKSQSLKSKWLGKTDPEAKKAEEDRVARINRAKEDSDFFCSYYLGHYFKGPDGQPTGLADWQHRIEEKLEGNDTLAVAAPRGHGKTTYISFGLTLKDLLTGKSKFTLYIGPTAEAAKERIAEIKMELEENERILEDFGDLLRGKNGRKTRQTANSLTLSNGARVSARGCGQSMRGIKNKEQRPDRAVIDDIDDNDEAKNPKRIAARIKWFQRVVYPLQGSLGMTILIVGNIIARNTFLTWALDNDEFASLLFRAIKDDGTPLMPLLWSLERLNEMRRKIGSDSFETEFQNNPPAEGNRSFQPEWLNERWTVEMLLEAEPAVVMALDLSMAKSERSDFQAFVAVQTDSKGRIYIVKVCLGRRSRKALIQRSFDLVEVIGREVLSSFVVESNGFQEWFKEELDEASAESGQHLPIRPQENRLNKYDRITKLSPIAEGRRLLFPPEEYEDESVRLLRQQLERFPDGHDDGPDALAMAVQEIARRKAGSKFRVIPITPMDRSDESKKYLERMSRGRRSC